MIMEDWTSGAWVVWLSLALGIGAYFAARTVEMVWRGSQIPKQMRRWIIELDHALRDLQGAELHKAVCYRRVADLIGDIPRDFDAVALTGLAMSDDIGRAILAKSEELGIYPKGTFSKLGVVAYDKLPTEPPQQVPASPLKEAVTEAKRTPILPVIPAPANGNGNGNGTVTPWIGSWVDGRLVPPTSSADDN
jgi:hypothetical protein